MLRVCEWRDTKRTPAFRALFRDPVKLMLPSIAQHEALFNSIVSRPEGEGLTDC
jgi:hypothetical protein